ncbi:MAG: 16S rRNA (cytidine(1402)-2'-O)-methyltransferase [Ignavibacteria bacterium]|nr:16S rRNA (cytidine(1402)-2'-O)-methyltransferase [Ignavibacteria bacterium]
MSPALYIVPTPIGNLEDITLRAIKVLTNANIIACEDTRRCGMLLKELAIITNATLRSYHDYNESEVSGRLIEEIANGKSVALISDAGTPCISDPGYRLVNKAIAAGIQIVPLPGATAFVPALVASGFAVHSFAFFGFPPQKKGRNSFINNALNQETTTILYESSHRIKKLIGEIAEIDANRNICIGREISKIYEEYIRFNTSEWLSNSINIIEKGEFVVLIEGRE